MKKKRVNSEKLYREGKLGNKPTKGYNVEAPLAKRKSTVSAEKVHEKGELGVSVPSGMPSGMPLGDYIKSVLHIVDKNGKTLKDSIIESQVFRAIAGDSNAVNFLMDRAYGKVAQTLQVTEAPVINISHNVIDIMEAEEAAESPKKTTLNDS